MTLGMSGPAGRYRTCTVSPWFETKPLAGSPSFAGTMIVHSSGMVRSSGRRGRRATKKNSVASSGWSKTA